MQSSYRPDLFVGRSVLVIGGTSGIGAAIARSFHDLGADTHVAGLNATDAPEGIASTEVDLLAPDQLESVIDGMSTLDVLVNSAGTIDRGAEYEPEVFARVVEVNLTGTMRACVRARPRLSESAGCIINLASMLSFLGGPLVPGYTASKGGVVALTKSLAVGLAADGIRVNALAPGWIATELTRDLRADAATDARLLARTPMGRWGTPEDVAAAAVFLASPEARFITGAVLPVDGGYLAA
ncbi:MAG: SDR family oxidoreductase [Mycobacterium sp.]|nr:SDR family oxidoreductase [Mycobacterium sp.]